MGWIFPVIIGALTAYLFERLPNSVLKAKRRTSEVDPNTLFEFEVETMALETTEGLHLHTYYAPATAPMRGNLIILHGRGGHKDAYLNYLPHLVPRGYNVLLYDSRAHGKSDGKYTTYGHHEWRDVITAADYMRYRAPELPTGVFGHSMGGAVAIQALAKNQELAFGIVESSFTHLEKIVNAYARKQTGMPVPQWLSDQILQRAGKFAFFDPKAIEPVNFARSVRQPVLVIHGEEDERVDVDNGRQLYAALEGPTKELYIVKGAGHDDVEVVGGAEYWVRLLGFIDKVCLP